MPDRNQYVLFKAVKTRLENKGKQLVCAFCGKPILIGQEVYRSQQRKKFYHLQCYRKLLH